MFLYLIISIMTYSIGRYLFHKIRNLPPTPFPILPLIGHFHLLKQPIHHSLTQLASVHGPIMLLHFGFRPVLVVSSLSAAEECFTTNDIVFANRPHLLLGKYLGNNYTNVGWASYGDNWRNLRKIVSLEVLSRHRLQTLMGIRDEEVQLLVRQLAMQRHTTAVDVRTVLFELTLNVLMRMICGKRLCGEGAKEAAEAKIFHEVVTEAIQLGRSTNLCDYFPLMGKIGFKGMENKLQRLQVKRDTLMQKLLDELKIVETGDDDDDVGKTKTKKKNMIEVLLSLQKTEPDYYSDVTIRGLMSFLVAAGTEMSISSLEWAMTLLLNHPEVLKKAQTEMDTTVGFDRFINESDLEKLSYLHCIISETFRMYPGGTLGAPHESSDECFVGGYRVPKGTMLLLNVYAIHMDPILWPEPHKFKPERFEGMDQGIKDGYKLLTFGLGRRSCPGENLALKMIGLTLGALIQCFEWGMTEVPGLSMPKAKPFMTKFRPRQNIKPLLSQMEVSFV